MQNFVDFIAKHIKDKDYNLENLTIVLPSQRAKKYISRALYNQYEKPIFAPEMVTIDRWVTSLVDEAVIDNTRALFKLYKIHEEKTKTDNDGFDAFLKWGKTLLSDFDEIDRYLIEAEDLFMNLRDIKDIEMWSFNSTEELTEGQKKFMQFWDSLPGYYYALQDLLKKEGTITAGGAFKKVANDLSLVFKKNKEMRFIFAGFNAMSESEISIIKQLQKMNRADVFIDADAFYYNDENHEAGLFLRKLKSELKITLPRIVNEIQSSEKTITVVNCKQATGQANVMSTIIEDMDEKQFNTTLLLLADESLVGPVLKNLPKKIGSANITLGLPLSSTSLRSWVDLIFGIQDNFRHFNTNAAYHKDLLKLFKHPFFVNILSENDEKILVDLESKIVERNILFMKPESINCSDGLKEIIQFIFTDWKGDFVKALSSIRTLNDAIFRLLDKEKNELEKAILLQFDNSLTALFDILTEFKPKISLSTFKVLFNQHWSKASVAYFGNPLDGLQIMGLLETRLLDFENIICVGLNEGKMPPNNAIQTIIPMDLRSYKGLPTPREKQGLFAHHIYRLLHKAKNVWITYSTAESSMGIGEPSRYLLQFKLELARQNKNIKFIEKDYTIADNKQDNAIKSIPKTDAILKRLDEYFEGKTSSSALNKYLACPLDFYYRYVLGFGEQNEVEEDIEANSFGSYIHNALEKMYEPFARRDGDGNLKEEVKRNVTSADIENMLKNYKRYIDEEFLSHFGNNKKYLETGKNYLSHQIALHLTEKFLKKEKKEIESREQKLFIESLEGTFTHNLKVNVGEDVKNVNFIGKIDRVHSWESDGISVKEIIDYKSGKCNQDQTELKSPSRQQTAEEKMFSYLGGYNFTLQLLIYRMLFYYKYKEHPKNAGIISLINLTESPFMLESNLGLNDDELLKTFESCIEKIISEVYDNDLPFQHNPDAKWCQYCN